MVKVFFQLGQFQSLTAQYVVGIIIVYLLTYLNKSIVT